MMGVATTIVFAREDLSIPGAAEPGTPPDNRRETAQTRFFDLISRSSPDVIVLDLSRASAGGTDTIMTVRRRTEIPILVVCNPGQPQMEDYRIAGAADCITAPLDIVSLNQTIQRIVRVRGGAKPASVKTRENFLFAGINFCARRNVLVGPIDPPIDLTGSEARLLTYFVSRPWTLCTRSEIAELLYGPEHLVGDRAIDVVVNRLRKKLVLAGGIEAEQLIKTEFRQGYLLVADVERAPYGPSVRSVPAEPQYA
ncbi:MAG: response regulator transcription factor [Alphaproteobacteria bacterium]|nr:response regulator transcription factor [Alphaproteobacteria bacterium]